MFGFWIKGVVLILSPIIPCPQYQVQSDCVIYTVFNKTSFSMLILTEKSWNKGVQCFLRLSCINCVVCVIWHIDDVSDFVSCLCMDYLVWRSVLKFT